MSLIDMVALGKRMEFSHYLNGNLWYKLECGFEFPISIHRLCAQTMMYRTDSAYLYGEHIRKQIRTLHKLTGEA